jgi:hypothetical protein
MKKQEEAPIEGQIEELERLGSRIMEGQQAEDLNRDFCKFLDIFVNISDHYRRQAKKPQK